MWPGEKRLTSNAHRALVSLLATYGHLWGPGASGEHDELRPHQVFFTA